MKNDFVNAPNDYRRSELLPDIIDLIERARKRGHVVTKKRIDEVIKYLKEDPEKCRDFIGWRYLGTKNYCEVFGADAESARLIKRQIKEIQDLRKTIQDLNIMIADLSMQLEVARTIPAEMGINTGGQLYRTM